MNASPVRSVTFDKFALERETMTCISLFTGAGGAALGVRQAGFEIRVMVEWEKAACETLRYNWVDRPDDWRAQLAAEEKAYRRLRNPARRLRETPHFWWQERPPAILNVDITKTSTKAILRAAGLKVGEASLLEGGFPCQGFSMAGARVIDDPRNALYKECVRVLREALPRAYMLENVPGLVSMAKGAVIRQICEDLAAAGYSVQWDILDAADFGVPQRRKRVFITGARQDVMTYDFKRGVPQLHMGALTGTITHPEWFTKKYPVV